MIGLSSTYYATKGLPIYESVRSVVELGFDAVELGAAHTYEENVWDVLHRLRGDFPHVNFTIHQLFPPFRDKIWFNTANGLSPINRQIVDHLFQSASIVEASLISIHAPILQDVSVGNKVAGNFYEPILGDRKDANLSKDNFSKLMEYIDKKARESITRVIIENMNTVLVDTFLSTKESFLEVFHKFADSGLLLDVGHALQCGNLNELLELKGHIPEIHLHETGTTPEGEIWAHFPIKSKSYFEPLKNFLTEKEILLIFEHGADVSENDIINEKQLLESFIEKLNAIS